jgi:hypothetical protein
MRRQSTTYPDPSAVAPGEATPGALVRTLACPTRALHRRESATRIASAFRAKHKHVTYSPQPGSGPHLGKARLVARGDSWLKPRRTVGDRAARRFIHLFGCEQLRGPHRRAPPKRWRSAKRPRPPRRREDRRSKTRRSRRTRSRGTPASRKRLPRRRPPPAADRCRPWHARPPHPEPFMSPGIDISAPRPPPCNRGIRPRLSRLTRLRRTVSRGRAGCIREPQREFCFRVKAEATDQAATRIGGKTAWALLAYRWEPWPCRPGARARHCAGDLAGDVERCMSALACRHDRGRGTLCRPS